MDLNDLFSNPEVVRVLATIAAVFVAAAITALSTYVGAVNLRKAWLVVRGQWPGVIGQVDAIGKPPADDAADGEAVKS